MVWLRELGSPGVLGPLHRGMDAARRPVLGRRHPSGPAATDLAASERRPSALDRVDDLEQGHLVGRTGQAVAALPSGDGFDDAGLCQRLQMLGEVRGRDAVVLGQPSRRAASGQAGRRASSEQQCSAHSTPSPICIPGHYESGYQMSTFLRVSVVPCVLASNTGGISAVVDARTRSGADGREELEEQAAVDRLVVLAGDLGKGGFALLVGLGAGGSGDGAGGLRAQGGELTGDLVGLRRILGSGITRRRETASGACWPFVGAASGGGSEIAAGHDVVDARDLDGERARDRSAPVRERARARATKRAGRDRSRHGRRDRWSMRLGRRSGRRWCASR